MPIFLNSSFGMTQGAFDFIVERFRYYAGTARGIMRDDVINAVLSVPPYIQAHFGSCRTCG